MSGYSVTVCLNNPIDRRNTLTISESLECGSCTGTRPRWRSVCLEPGILYCKLLHTQNTSGFVQDCPRPRSSGPAGQAIHSEPLGPDVPGVGRKGRGGGNPRIPRLQEGRARGCTRTRKGGGEARAAPGTRGCVDTGERHGWTNSPEMVI